MNIKKKIKNLFELFGLEIKRKNREIINLSFDEIYKNKIRENPVIFDVGANQGQSIERFKKIFAEPTIHAFEPIKDEYDKLLKKYCDQKNIILNNYAIGESNREQNLFVTALTGNSSFNKLNTNTKWLKTRSSQAKTTMANYTKAEEKVKIISLDNYCKDNNIYEIDLLKIDTQGFEDKVLAGCNQILKNNIISAIESEIMLDNVYDKYLSFSDLEKYLIPNNFRLVGLNTINNNLFSGIVFFADILYFNKNKFKL
tara:strand:+ start:276 stop:1043 length:768 start_codon:yes stop_codon:yes gene_type:complete